MGGFNQMKTIEFDEQEMHLLQVALHLLRSGLETAVSHWNDYPFEERQTNQKLLLHTQAL